MSANYLTTSWAWTERDKFAGLHDTEGQAPPDPVTPKLSVDRTAVMVGSAATSDRLFWFWKVSRV